MTRTISRRRGPVRTAALGALVVALAAGCSGGTDDAAPDAGDDPAVSDDGGAADDSGEDTTASDEGGDDAAAPGASPLPESADLATEELPIPAEEAVRLAVDAAAGGDAVSVQIDHEDDRGWVWEIEVALDGKEHGIDVDAATGEILEHDEEDDAVVDPPVDVTDPLPYQEAIDLALQERDGRVTGWDLDSDDGRLRYQIDIEQGDDDEEVEVDVETREVRVDD